VNILFKYPSMWRPDWFKKTLKRYYSMLSGKNQYRFLITLNEDDKTMNSNEMRRNLDNLPNLMYKYGEHKTKVEAINADMEGEDFDILFLVSDDMIPMVRNFDVIIAKKMEKYFPDLDGALHFNDACCGQDNCITLSIMGKKLYDYFGYIYHPDYKSFFCDQEFTEAVRRLGKVKYFSQVVVKHDWKGWGKKRDGVYTRNTELGRGDKETYIRRKELDFPR